MLLGGIGNKGEPTATEQKLRSVAIFYLRLQRFSFVFHLAFLDFPVFKK